MIIESSIRDEEAYEHFRDALQDLLMLFPLAGLSYLGEAVEVREDASIKTLATDGRRVFYSPAWLKKITLEACVFDILHEWLHIFFNHVARRGDRDPQIWNIAVDVVVVRECCTILSTPSKHVQPPEDGVIPPDWAKDMSAEEIYDALVQHKHPNPKMPKGTGEHQTSGDLLYEMAQEYAETVGSEEEFHQKFTEELAQATLIQQQIKGDDLSKFYGKNVTSRLSEILKGKLPWSRLLRGRLISDIGEDEPTYSPPNRKYYAELLLPSMRSVKEPLLFLPIDVSASIGPTLIKQYIANVIPAAMRAEETVVVTFDQVVREVYRTKNPRTILNNIKFLSGHHSYTSTIGVFELYDRIKPKACACLTDGIIELPKKTYPNTLWILPYGARPQPWGRNFFMELSW